MIDLNKIRTMPPLKAMRLVLRTFLNYDRDKLLAVYTAADEGEEDFEADREAAQELLKRVDTRIMSLGNHLARVKNDQPSSDAPKTEVGSSAS